MNAGAFFLGDPCHVGASDELERTIPGGRQPHRDGPGGGFVFAHTHNIQPGVPPANVVAMLEAVNEYGAYPLA